MPKSPIHKNPFFRRILEMMIGFVVFELLFVLFRMGAGYYSSLG
jgi:hypothetical protein